MSLKKIFTAIVTSVVLLACCGFTLAEPSSSEVTEKEKVFSLEEKRWAVQWINERLSLLMEDGLIKRIKCYENDVNYEVFVSSSWSFLTLEEKKDFLSDLSRAREITLHSPYLSVRHFETGEVLAKVNKWGIFIFDGSGEYFIPLVEDEEN